MPANELLTEIHNAKQRMPLILPPEAVDIWLTGTPEQATLSFEIAGT
jgi:putative SOS response-associated peptidase YedK